MSGTAKDFTKLLEEVKKTKKTADHLLDFADLMKNKNENVTGDLVTPGENIRELGYSLHKLLDEINTQIFGDLNKLPVDQDEVKNSAEKLLLYQNKEQVLVWAEQQKANHPENSYWWKFWDGIFNYMSNK